MLSHVIPCWKTFFFSYSKNYVKPALTIFKSSFLLLSNLQTQCSTKDDVTVSLSKDVLEIKKNVQCIYDRLIGLRVSVSNY